MISLNLPTSSISFKVFRLNWFDLKKTVFTNTHFYSQAYKSKYYTRIKLLCAVQILHPTGFIYIFIYLLTYFVVLGTEPRTSCMLGKCSTSELHSQISFQVFETGLTKRCALNLRSSCLCLPWNQDYKKVNNTNK